MTRKDSEKDLERPHYYSQFWLDIAAGRRTIGGPRPEDGEATEPEIEAEVTEPVLQRRPVRVSEPETFPDTSSTAPDAYSTANEQQEEVVHPAADEEYSEPEDVPAQEAEELHDLEYQEDLPLEDEGIPDMDLNVEEEDEEVVEEEATDEEEEDENMNWGRGRKKPKPIRPTKAPVKKPGKPRRSF